MTRAAQNRLLVVAALLVAGGALAYIAYGSMGDNLVYYLTPDELIQKGDGAKGPTVRLGGLVVKKSIDWKPNTLELAFKVAMTPDAENGIVVHSTGAPPQMFQEGIGAVVEGTFDGKVFHAERVLVKHSNEYRPPAPGEQPKDMYGTLVQPADDSAAPEGKALGGGGRP